MYSPLDIQMENNNKDVYILQGNYMYDVMQDLVHHQIVFFSIKYPQDVHHFQLPGYPVWYHTKIRPGAVNFLKSISELYELHIFTMGSRMYAHTIARMLDPDGKLFAYRIRSRDECFNAFSKSHDMRLVHNNAHNMQFCVLQSRSVISLFLFSVVYSPLKKRGDWSRSVSCNNCFLDHYLRCASQLLANSFSLSPVTVQEVCAKVYPFAPGNFAEKRVLKLVERFSGYCRAMQS